MFLCKKIKIEVSEQDLSKAYQRVSEKKRHKQKDRLHKASHLIAHTLVEKTVVVRSGKSKQHLNRAVYNE